MLEMELRPMSDGVSGALPLLELPCWEGSSAVCCACWA